MNREIKLKKLAKLNRLILFGNYNKNSLNFLKSVRKDFTKTIEKGVNN